MPYHLSNNKTTLCLKKLHWCSIL